MGLMDLLPISSTLKVPSDDTDTMLPTLRYRRYATDATLPTLRYRRYATDATLPTLRYRCYATDATLPTLRYRRYATDSVGRIPKFKSRIFLKRYLTLYLYLIINVVTRAFIGIPIFGLK